MIGKNNRDQKKLFIPGDIENYIPEDHVLKRVDRVLDLSWLYDEVKSHYCLDNGRPGIDPESAVRLMLAGFFHGIVHDRKLMREAQVNLAIRWFAGYSLDDSLPDHSSLSRIRKRWGKGLFKEIFKRIVQSCIDAGMVDGETVHIDATLIRADVSWSSITERHVEEVISENDTDEKSESGKTKKGPGGTGTRSKKPKKVSRTDPDATMATSSNSFHLEPTYKQHTSVDDKDGIIVDVDLTTGEKNEGTILIETVERIEESTGKKIENLTADSGYAHSANYQALEDRGTDAIIPPQKTGRRGKSIPSRRFKYDAKNQLVKCPGGKLIKKSYRGKNGWIYRAKKAVCVNCRLHDRCIPAPAKCRTIFIVDGYESLLRARRRKLRGWDEKTRDLYNRHRWLVEGVHGESKTQHGLRRAIRRGLDNVAIQAYLTAAVINLKRLARASSSPCFHLHNINIERLNRLFSIIKQKFFSRRLCLSLAR